ncbi:MAG TPA: AIR synthase-related protein, partial [Clostridiales bacterium]|nr:AIR synthase-related protein [Clostridiales bacterium]
MALVRRLFVEKKEGFDLEAGRVLADLRDTLGIPGLEALRLFNRYDVEGLGGADFDTAAATILSEPNADRIYDRLPDMDASLVFAVEYLPGQYDQRADSASQCIALLTLQTPPKVLTARVYALFGRLTAGECEKIKNYLVNPVEARLASMEPYDSLDLKTQPPGKIADVAGFLGMDGEAMARYHASMGFAMSVEDLLFCRDYFLAEGREPTETELRVIDTYWSDHCRHTTFLTRLERVEVRPGGLSAGIEAALNEYMAARAELYAGRQKDISLMDMATIGGKLLAGRGLAADVDVSEEINACSIETEVVVDGEPQRWLVQFKNETHNHPTEIEPFGGAATCLGGAIRDPLSGRAYVYQAMRVTGSGNPLTPFEQTVPGKLPQKKITVGAAQGYSSYGNQIGLATGQVTELYDEGYVAKRLEIGAVIGASPKSNVRREAPAPGDVVVLLGGRTGRDGCGGATGSSKAHDSSSIETCGAEVQKGNPPTERKLQRLFRDPAAARLIKRCNDFGAGGVSVAIGELARGLDINLDAVPKKYEGLGGTELAISESQERMAVVVREKDAAAFIA